MIGLLGAVIVVTLVFIARAGTPSPTADGPGSSVIEALVPAEGTEALRQTRVGIDLVPGWEGRLAVNGVDIPEEQLLLVPELNQVFFIPGPTTLVEELQAGRNCVTARFWPSAQGPTESITRTWCFEAT